MQQGTRKKKKRRKGGYVEDENERKLREEKHRREAKRNTRDKRTSAPAKDMENDRDSNRVLHSHPPLLPFFFFFFLLLLLLLIIISMRRCPIHILLESEEAQHTVSSILLLLDRTDNKEHDMRPQQNTIQHKKPHRQVKSRDRAILDGGRERFFPKRG